MFGLVHGVIFYVFLSYTIAQNLDAGDLAPQKQHYYSPTLPLLLCLCPWPRGSFPRTRPRTNTIPYGTEASSPFPLSPQEIGSLWTRLQVPTLTRLPPAPLQTTRSLDVLLFDV